MRQKLKFLISQSGTNAPTLVILNSSDSDFLGTPVASRPSQGRTALTFTNSDLFDEKRMVYFKPCGTTDASSRNGIINGAGIGSPNQVYFNTVDLDSGASEDDLLKDTYGELIVEDL